MTFLIRATADEWVRQECRILVEDAFDTFDERKVGIAAYNCIKKTVLESLTDESLKKYLNDKVNGGGNEDLFFKDNIKLETKPDGAKGYFFDICFYMDGAKYSFTLGICHLLPGGIRQYVAGFDPDTNTLYLPFLVSQANCQADCHTISQIEGTRGTIIHEIKHKIDSITTPTSEFDKIPDPDINRSGYYNHRLEKHAYDLEMIDFILTGAFRNVTNDPKQLNAMCNDNDVFHNLESYFSNDTKPSEYGSEAEFNDLKKYYTSLNVEHRKKLAKQVAEYYRDILKTKLEQTEDKNSPLKQEALRDTVIKLYQQK